MALDSPVQDPVRPTMVSRFEIEEYQWQPVESSAGVSSKVLRRSGGAATALISYQPHARTAGKPHRDAVQHIWIVSGQALVDGRWLPAGSYVHVPAGAAHPITAGGPDGCTLLQVHVPT